MHFLQVTPRCGKLCITLLRLLLAPCWGWKRWGRERENEREKGERERKERKREEKERDRKRGGESGREGERACVRVRKRESRCVCVCVCVCVCLFFSMSHMTELCHIWIRHVTWVSRVTYDWHKSFTCDTDTEARTDHFQRCVFEKKHVKSRLTRKMTHSITRSYVGYDSFICDMTHSCVGHDSFMCVTWLIHMCDMTHSYVECHSFMCDMTSSKPAPHFRKRTCEVTFHVLHDSCHDSFICRILVHMCDMTHSYVWHDFCNTSSLFSNQKVWSHVAYDWGTSYLNVLCHAYEWVKTHMWMSHDAHMNEPWHIWVTHMNEPWHKYEWVVLHIWMGHVPHVNG